VSDDASFPAADIPNVRIFKSERAAMPMTIGIFPRKIFVPVAWDRWPGECRRMVIRHEIAHISRYDGVFQVIQILARAVYFFHPLVILLDRRLKECREMACDDASIGKDESSSVQYSRYLVEIAEGLVKRPVACETMSALIRRKNELLNRVTYQMKGGAMRSMSRKRVGVILAALIVMILPLSWYFGNAAPGEESGSSGRNDIVSAAKPGISDKSTSTAESEKKSIKFSIKGDNKFKIDGDTADMEDVRQKLLKLNEKMLNDYVVKLECDDEVKMGQVYLIQRMLMELDLFKIAYVNEFGTGLPLVMPPFDIKERMSEIPAANFSKIEIDASGLIRLDGEGIDLSKINDAVKEKLAQNAALIITIRTTEETEYRVFVKVLEEVKRAGAQRIMIDVPAIYGE
jgi:biopolymer transport protein ExbD